MYKLIVTFTDGATVVSIAVDEESVRAIYNIIGDTNTRIRIPLENGSIYMTSGERIKHIIAVPETETTP